MKTAIITGADGGMGREHTIALAKAGCKIIMTSTKQQKGEKICEELKQKTQWEHISVKQLNLEDLDSIVDFCKTINVDKINILLNNAGTLPSVPKTTKQGFDYTIGVNFLGHFLLTELLYPHFTAGTKIVNMVSLTYKYGKIFNNFFAPTLTHYNRFVNYSNSKLALYYATLYWAEKWKDKNILVNCADPGIVSTKIIKMDNTVVDTLCDIFFRPIIRTPKQGADTMSYIAINDINNISGEMFKSRKIHHVSDKIKKSPQKNLLLQQTFDILSPYLSE